MPAFRLDGKTALVTGASSGLGAHFARVLADAGAAVVLAARRQEQLAEQVAAIHDAGGSARALTLDVTDPDSVQQAMSALSADGGSDAARPWLLLNLSGVVASRLENDPSFAGVAAGLAAGCCLAGSTPVCWTAHE